MRRRGTLIYEVFAIAARTRPRVALLENVKHLQQHDGGRTLATILRGLEVLGYMVSWRVLNASQFVVSQNRERVIIVGTAEWNLLV